ncbi:MAG: hypothetical protein A2284_02045 [Deltaproteobacteria bacterium RIFOXYA12_FULL_61_11]|nr:MAG: hypothetical protein A2284_02045 [Deltaproteobacteria bacterium RIFOXYA12_FULL_61_11]
MPGRASVIRGKDGLLGCLLIGCLLSGATAAQEASGLLGVALECQQAGGTKVCTHFLPGFLERLPGVRPTSRAEAGVILFVNAVEHQGEDVVHLRAVASVEGAPAEFETKGLLDTHATDEDQLQVCRRSLLSVLAPYLIVINPEAVHIEVDEGVVREPVRTGSPWGASLTLSGYGSRNGAYSDLEGTTSLKVMRITTTDRLVGSLTGGTYLSRQPPIVSEGDELSLDTTSYSFGGSLSGSRNLGEHWAVGVVGRAGGMDDKARYAHTERLNVASSYDLFPADEPRGNRLFALVGAGVQYDKYNYINILNERSAAFPGGMVIIGGNVRYDRFEFGTDLGCAAQLPAFERRYELDLSPSAVVQLGEHLDVSLALTFKKQVVPGPLQLDQSDYEAVTRATYAEPLYLYLDLSMTLYLDRSSAERNNRLDLFDMMGSFTTF